MRTPVSVIVPAYNAEATLGECLDALRAAMTPEDQLILFDDGSTDDTLAIAERAGAQILRNRDKPKGPAHARNSAASVADRKYLMFVDADVVVHQDVIDRLVGEAEAVGAVAAFGSYDDRPRSQRLSSLYANLRHHFVHQGGSRGAMTFWTGIGLIEADTFRAYGGYDEVQFPHPSIEDVELGMRIVNSGGRIRLVPEAQGVHCKDWTLRCLWHTDVVRRALPWSRLVADGKASAPDLNLARNERIVAAIALSIVPAIVGAFFIDDLWMAALVLAAVFLFSIRRFLGVLRKHMNPVQLLVAAGLHWIYYVYASVTYASVIAATRLGLRRPARFAARPPLERTVQPTT
jgi:glycosyltransferase involved in cell wall biosynthesis